MTMTSTMTIKMIKRIIIVLKAAGLVSSSCHTVFSPLLTENPELAPILTFASPWFTKTCLLHARPNIRFLVVLKSLDKILAGFLFFSCQAVE